MSGDVYVGEFSEGQRHGQGKMTMSSGKQTYEGKWENGLPEGQGVETQENGDTYDGEFKQGKRHG